METQIYKMILSHIYLVLILPMRNGNAFKTEKKVSVYLSSYPTYEEWKLILKKGLTEEQAGSYPTYEEWKLFSFPSY